MATKDTEITVLIAVPANSEFKSLQDVVDWQQKNYSQVCMDASVVMNIAEYGEGAERHAVFSPFLVGRSNCKFFPTVLCRGWKKVQIKYRFVRRNGAIFPVKLNFFPVPAAAPRKKCRFSAEPSQVRGGNIRQSVV